MGEKNRRQQQLAKKAHLPTGPSSGAEDLPREEGKNIAAEVFSSYKTWEMESYGWEKVTSGRPQAVRWGSTEHVPCSRSCSVPV